MRSALICYRSSRPILGHDERLLDTVLATEIVCYLRYMPHAFVANGIDAASATPAFREHATEKLGHAMRVEARICQLGGVPHLNPSSLAPMASTSTATLCGR